MTIPAIDIKSVPSTQVNWPAAFRLRPLQVPSKPTLARIDDDADGLSALIGLTSPVVRHESNIVPLAFDTPLSMPASVRSAFAHPAPEWRFAQSNMPHMTVADTMQGAVAIAVEHYSQFLKDTHQPACQLSLIVERFLLSGTFSDVTDEETFALCYDKAGHAVSQNLVVAALDQGIDGLLFKACNGTAAVVLNPTRITMCAQERALALDWNGHGFTQYYDYRDLHWTVLRADALAV